MPSSAENEIGSLERARERLYQPEALEKEYVPSEAPQRTSVPHEWKEKLVRRAFSGARHVRFASVFFAAAFTFFILALIVAGYFFFSGGNAVSVDKITIDIQGPSTISGGDTVPLSVTITNKNATALEQAIIEINFPNGTRSADNVLSAYPRYTEELGSVASGEVITRSVKAVVFGGSGEALSLPVSLSFKTVGSNAVFVKKTSFQFAVSSTPLGITVDAPSEVTSGKPFTLVLTVRSNATVPLDNVVLSSSFPFGFSVVSSSPALNNSSFLIGTLSPGGSKTVTLTGVLAGQDTEQRMFRFLVGTAKSSQDSSLAVTYMAQDTTIIIAPHFIDTVLALNGNTASNVVIAPGSLQNATVSYSNTLATGIQNAVVSIALSGSAVDYDSIKTSNGFYRSSDRTIVFNQDADPALASLAPGASGIGSFSFMTRASGLLPAAPSVILTVSVSGTPAGGAEILEQVNVSATKTAKVMTTVALTSSALRTSGPFSNTGPIPPRANQATTYSIQWHVQNQGSTVAGGAVSTVLPSYVSYTGETSGSGLSYDKTSRTVSWNTGDLTQNGSAQAAFQVSLTPSTSQKGTAPKLTGSVSFSGFDRFAGVSVSAAAGPVTTETASDPGYVGANALVQ